jgi:hypothetical protein
MEALEPLIRSGRLLFSTQMGKAVECRSQFVNFELVEVRGIIECVAKASNKIPMSIFRANMAEDELEYIRRRREEGLHAQFLEQMGYDRADEEQKQKLIAHQEAMSKVTNLGFPSLPGGLDG